MQAVLRRDDRLPSRRGSPSSSLTVAAQVERPDMTALIAGRCPSGTAWAGSACEAARESTPSSVVCPPGMRWTNGQCLVELDGGQRVVAQFTSTPAGAAVRVDGVLACEQTPCSAEEWQRVASNGGRTGYPWGDADPEGTRANCDGPGRFRRTSPACSFPAGHNRDGVCDLAGNVWEWTATDYNSSSKELRGGSWNRSPPFLRAGFRSWGWPDGRGDVLGFRCAQ